MKKLICVLTAGILFVPSLVCAHCNEAAYQNALTYAEANKVRDRLILVRTEQKTQKFASLLHAIYAFNDSVAEYLEDYGINYSKYTCEQRDGADELATFILAQISPLVDAVLKTSLDEEVRDVLIRKYLNLDNRDKGFVLGEFLYDYNQHLFNVDEESTAIEGWKEFMEIFNNAVYGDADYAPYTFKPSVGVFGTPEERAKLSAALSAK
jgi:hypothetical protein